MFSLDNVFHIISISVLFILFYFVFLLFLLFFFLLISGYGKWFDTGVLLIWLRSWWERKWFVFHFALVIRFGAALSVDIFSAISGWALKLSELNSFKNYCFPFLLKLRFYFLKSSRFGNFFVILNYFLFDSSFVKFNFSFSSIYSSLLFSLWSFDIWSVYRGYEISLSIFN